MAAHIAKGIPLMIIQKTLAITDGAPPPYCTSLPKGASANEANLKHCLSWRYTAYCYYSSLQKGCESCTRSDISCIEN